MQIMQKIHHFDDSGAAYDMAQCSPEVNKGDILVIESEKVVGLAHTWPVAVTKNAGHLHQVEEGKNLMILTGEMFTIEQIENALTVAKEHGWDL